MKKKKTNKKKPKKLPSSLQAPPISPIRTRMWPQRLPVRPYWGIVWPLSVCHILKS